MKIQTHKLELALAMEHIECLRTNLAELTHVAIGHPRKANPAIDRICEELELILESYDRRER